MRVHRRGDGVIMKDIVFYYYKYNLVFYFPFSHAKSRDRVELFDERLEPFDRADVTEPGGDGNSAPKPNSTKFQNQYKVEVGQKYLVSFSTSQHRNVPMRLIVWSGQTRVSGLNLIAMRQIALIAPVNAMAMGWAGGGRPY